MTSNNRMPSIDIKDTQLTQRDSLSLLQPDWPAPASVQAYCTTRQAGFSVGQYASLNLAMHVNDVPAHVARNRERLQSTLGLPTSPVWLNQVHSDVAVELHKPMAPVAADASYTWQTSLACVVMTADCLPVLMCNQQGTWVAAVHAGWRGLASQIISHTIQRYDGAREDLLLWLGPAISATHYEVDHQVYTAFVSQDAAYEAAFTATRPQHYLLDVYQAARVECASLGLHDGQIYGGDACTYTQADLFYSYRRDGAHTGRMASLIWRDE